MLSPCCVDQPVPTGMDLPGLALITLHGLKSCRFLIVQFRSGAGPGAMQIASLGIWKSIWSINVFWLVCSVDYLCSRFAWLPVFSVSCPCPSQGPFSCRWTALWAAFTSAPALFLFFFFFLLSDWFVGPQPYFSGSDLGKPHVWVRAVLVLDEHSRLL